MGGTTTRSSKRPQFDLSNQDGVLHALYAVRTSEMTTSERNTLRDQLFLLSRTGDERLREQLEGKLADVPLSAEFIQTTSNRMNKQAAQAGQSGFASARRTPQFVVRQQSPVATITPPPSVPEVETTSADTDTQTVSTEAPRNDITPPSVTAAVPDAAPADESVVTEPIARDSRQATEPAPSVAVATEAPAPTPGDPAPAGESEAFPPTLDRIREIKRYVNERIGNPVNLVDLDNEVGRSYMTSLLAAMQSVNNETGRAGTAEMDTLEHVFRRVQELLLTAEAESESVPPLEEQPEPRVGSASPTTAEPVATDILPPTTPTAPPGDTSPIPLSRGREPAPANNKEEATAVNPTAVPAAPAPVPNPTTVATQVTEASVTPLASTTASFTPQAVPSPAAAMPSHAVSDTPPPLRNPVPNRQADPAGVDASAPSPLARNEESGAPPPVTPAASLAADVRQNIDNQLHTLDAAAAARNQYDGDPLYASEIDRGLEQLLQEWSLFQTSGLFGTGPSGREHPLFKKLSPIMVNDILLGKFDGSRPEIIQSITDYMNGWRYEQGIVYQPGETFETYLRRVIRFIIDSKA